MIPGTGAPDDEAPLVTALRCVRPNPARGGSRIEYSLGQEGHVLIEVFNVSGQKVRTLTDRREPAGTRSLVWDGTDDAGVPVSSGVYMVGMAAGDYTGRWKLAVVR